MAPPVTRWVLDVGNCGPDHVAIRTLVESHFAAEVTAAPDGATAVAQLRARACDLVLVNRKLDSDYSDGLEVVRAIKADPQLAAVPVMLVTNYEEHQQAAIAAGATRGFGKLSLRDPRTVERLREFLG